jgi:adenosine deaminase
MLAAHPARGRGVWLNAEMDLRTTTKVDLHRHLEGAMRLQTIIDLYREAGEPLPETTPDELAPRAQIRTPMASLEEALQVLEVVQGSFRSYDAVERIAAEAVEDLALDHVPLAELRFSPEFFFGPGGLDWDDAMDALVAGATRSAEEHGVAVGLIAIFSRDYGLESARRTVEFTLRHHDRLVGFDIAGNEPPYPPALYRDIVAPIHEAGIHVTAHYGESGPAEYVRDAIEILGAQRIAHGVAIAADPEVLALARDRNIVLDVCPTSNLLTGEISSPEEHPALRLFRAGVPVTLNTDDPGLFGIDLTHEYEFARDVLGFTDDDLRRTTSIALDASFLPEGIKADVRPRHFGWLDQEDQPAD